ncbi:MAG: hypothetical protein U0900_12965 [Myxococcota bacterium]
MTDSASPTAEQLRASMECVVLGPRPGARLSDRPPVEIFLGTEPAQYRANRVFGFSIEKVRDPGREVRIFFMSELPGFDRRGWTTGFTNYRFAIPAFCGGHGRAIYNDEDEIYLTDPGELFDLDLAGAGYLAISDTESSVMLIDCERMAPVWTLREAQHAWKRALLRKASKATGHRGDLDPHWNARDEEFVPGRSHLLHYTTLHTQPWRPFPERFVYQEGAYTQLWHDLEREAIARGFELFHRAAPSRLFAAHCRRLEGVARGELPSAVGEQGVIGRACEALARQTKSRGAIELLPDLRGGAESRPGRFGLDVERRLGLLEWLAEGPGAAVEDGIVCVDGLEGIPVWDVPWIVESLFERAGRFVFVAVRCRETPSRRFLHPPAGTVFTPDWWRAHFEAAAVRHPGVRWELVTTRGRDFERDGYHVAFGGPRQDATPPRIWTWTDGEPGPEQAAQALANALGGASRSLRGRGEEAGSPAPDLLIVAGREVAEPARRLREQGRGRCLVVALGADAALPIDEVDLAVVLPGETLFPHPRKLEIDLPLVPPLPRAAALAPPLAELAARAGPRLVIRLEAEAAAPLDVREAEALGRRIAESARALSATVVLSASSIWGEAIVEACRRGLGGAALVVRDPAAGVEGREVGARPWPGLLALGDVFVLVGAGEATWARVTATGRPIFVAGLAATASGASGPSASGTGKGTGPIHALRARLVDAVVTRARARPANDRGTTRPQEGLEWLCARLVERGVVRPQREPDALARGLIAAGRARVLAGPITANDLAGFAPGPAPALERVAGRVRALLGTDAIG